MVRNSARRRLWRRAAFHLVVITALFASAAVAGEWRAAGTGPAVAKSDKAKPLVVTAATPTNLIYPGGIGDAALRITNPNPWEVTVHSIRSSGAITTTAVGCNAASVTFTDQPGSWVLPKKAGAVDGTLDVVLAGAVGMAADADDACQDATFTIPVQASTDPLVQYVAVGSISGSALVSTSFDGSTWTTRTAGTSSTLRDVAYGSGRWVAVGNAGTIVTSDDGTVWTARSSGTTSVLNAVRRNGSTWVVGGGYGAILTSADGVTWTSRTSGTSGDVSGVAWNGTKWLAVANYAGQMVPLSSTDSVTWTAGTPVGGSANSLEWINNRWIAVSRPVSGGTGGVLISTDGATWTAGTSSSGNAFGRVAWNGSFLLEAGSIVYSSYNNGLTWSLVSTAPTWMSGIVWDGAQFLLAGSGAVYTTPDGVSYTQHAVANSYFNSVAAR